MEEEWYIDDEEEYDFLQECSVDSIYHPSYNEHSSHTEEEDLEKKELKDEILEIDRLLEKLKRLPKYKQYKPYHYYPYSDKPLYDYTAKELERILRNLKNRLLSIIWSFGYRPSDRPEFYPNLPKEFDKYPFKNPLYRLYHKWVAPTKILSEILPPFRAEVTLSEEDVEYLQFTLTNMEYLSELATIRVQGMLQDGTLKEIDLVKMLRHSLSNPKIPSEDRKAIQDELIRWELQNLPKYKTAKYERLWNEYYRLMADRRKDQEAQEKQLLSDGLKRRRYIETLRHQAPFSSKQAKKEEDLKIDSAEMMCKLLSSKSRRGKEGK